MNPKQILKISLKTICLMLCLLVFYGCENEGYSGNLVINKIEFTETYSNKALNLPNGTYMPDNPSFDINKPDTWTGNMAQYVNYNYIYSVTYQIKNTGGRTAYDTEIDLYYLFDNGEEEVETIFIGDINSNGSISKSTTISSTNKKLNECSGEVFWYD